MISLRLDDRFLSFSAYKFQRLLDSPEITFKCLKDLRIYDALSTFDHTLFFRRHQNLVYLRYVSNPQHKQTVIDFTTMPFLATFNGSVVHATDFVRSGTSCNKSITLKGILPSAIEWYNFTVALRLSTNVTILHMRDPGGYLFRHIQLVAAALPQLRSLSFTLCSHWRGWKVSFV